MGNDGDSFRLIQVLPLTLQCLELDLEAGRHVRESVAAKVNVI